MIVRISKAPQRAAGSGHSVINRLLAGVALLALPAAAAAQTVEIGDQRTQSVQTSNAAGSGPADIVVLAAGRITVGSGAAVIIDSSNTLDNSGALLSEADSGGIGVDVRTGSGITSGIINRGFIDALPDVELAESNDPNIIIADRVNSRGPNFGIRISGAGAFTGDITQTAGTRLRAIGGGSIGLDLGTAMIGGIDNAGTIETLGEGSIALRIGGTLSGDIVNSGTIRTSGLGGGTAIRIEQDVGGGLRNLGSVSTGRAATFDRRFDLVQEEAGGPGLAVFADIAGGIRNGPASSATDDTVGAFGQISALGNSAILVSAGDRDVQIGAVGTGENAFGIVNRAVLNSTSVLRDLDISTIRVEGAVVDGDIFRAVFAGGILNDARGTINAVAADGMAAGISVGNHAVVPAIVNRGTIIAASNIFTLDDDFDGRFEEIGIGGDAAGIFIDVDGEVNSIVNAGTIQVGIQGAAASAFGVLDRSGTVSDFTNSGTITLNVAQATGGIVRAVDFSANTGGITFTNSGTIAGTVALGSGVDTVRLPGGTHLGTIDFGAGGGLLELTDNALFSGQIRGAPVDLLVTDSLFASISGEALAIGNGSFSGASTISLGILAGQNDDGVLVADGVVSVAESVVIRPNFFVFPRADDPFVLISARQIDLAGGLAGLNIDLALSSIVFEQELALTGNAGREQLVLNLRLRDAAEIGLTGRRALLFDAATEVLVNDDALGSAIANITSADTLGKAMDQLMPDISSISRHVATTAQNLSTNALSQRFRSVRQINMAPIPEVPEQARPAQDRELARERAGWSFYAKEVGYISDLDADPEIDQFGYQGYNVGLMLGADKPLFGLDAFGFSLMESIADFEDDLTADSDLEIISTQANVYGTLSHGGFFVDLVGTFAYHDLERTRTVAFENFSRDVSADWTALQYGASLNAGYRVPLGRWGLTLAGTANYTTLDEDSFTENSGGGIALEVDSRKTTSLRAGANFVIDAQYMIDDEILFIPSIRGGFLSELDDTEIVTNARFAGGTRDIELVTPIEQDDTVTGGFALSFINRNLVITIAYDAERSSDFFSHMGSLTARLRF